jgi:hypothetical protein
LKHHATAETVVGAVGVVVVVVVVAAAVAVEVTVTGAGVDVITGLVAVAVTLVVGVTVVVITTVGVAATTVSGVSVDAADESGLIELDDGAGGLDGTGATPETLSSATLSATVPVAELVTGDIDAEQPDVRTRATNAPTPMR